MGTLPRMIGHYEIDRPLRSGGMGVLYKARDTKLNRVVALKVLHAELDTPDVRDRFTREAQAAAGLTHPNIVVTYESGEDGALPFIAMEYIHGETLAEIITRKARHADVQKLRWLEELCAGLGFAHTTGIVHRDVKPANVMIDAHGHLKVLDFGIAMVANSLATRSTASIGTPAYMAPEQIEGKPVDLRADIFSVGAVTYELLSYTPAYPGDSPTNVMNAILAGPATPIGAVYPEIDPALAGAVMKALARHPADRFENAGALAVVLTDARRRLEARSSGMRRMSRLAVPATEGKSATSASHLTPAAKDSHRGAGTPSGRRYTDPEVLARRRAEQMERLLSHAQEQVSQEQFDEAVCLCEQALAIEDGHEGALSLLERSRAGMDHKRATRLLATARERLANRDVTRAESDVGDAYVLDPAHPELGGVQLALRIARADRERLRKRQDAVQEALRRAREAIVAGDAEGGLADARLAIDLDSGSSDAHALERQARRMLNEEASEDIDTRAREAVREAHRFAGGGDLTRAVALLSAFTPGHSLVSNALRDLECWETAHDDPPAETFDRGQTVRCDPPVPRELAEPAAPSAPARPMGVEPTLPPGLRAPARSFQAIRLVTSSRLVQTTLGLLLVGGVAMGVMAFGAPASAPVPTGIVVIDAVPWATITRVIGKSGPIPLPAHISTPAVLTLPAGDYTVVIAGPPPSSVERTLSASVSAGQRQVLPTEMFDPVSSDSYFRNDAAPAGDRQDGDAAGMSTK